MSKAFRDCFRDTNCYMPAAFQIREMRAARGWTQEELARRAGIRQEAVSRLEDPMASPSLQSLVRVAVAFDVGLSVRFGTFSEFMLLLAEAATGGDVPSFEDDKALHDLAGDPSPSQG